jgi:hypothetical protein
VLLMRFRRRETNANVVASPSVTVQIAASTSQAISSTKQEVLISLVIRVPS